MNYLYAALSGGTLLQSVMSQVRNVNYNSLKLAVDLYKFQNMLPFKKIMPIAMHLFPMASHFYTVLPHNISNVNSDCYVRNRIRTTPHPEDNSPPYRFWSWWVDLFRGSGPSGGPSGGIVLGIVFLVGNGWALFLSGGESSSWGGVLEPFHMNMLRIFKAFPPEFVCRLLCPAPPPPPSKKSSWSSYKKTGYVPNHSVSITTGTCSQLHHRFWYTCNTLLHFLSCWNIYSFVVYPNIVLQTSTCTVIA